MSLWNYDDWFAPPALATDTRAVGEAEAYVVARQIEKHPFFEFAASSPKALEAWVCQELHVTGPFSQLLLRVASSLKNVHLRAMLLNVALGEHGSLDRQGVATGSHPWLLHTLRESMRIPPQSVIRYVETERFLGVLEEECRDTLCGLAALGVGNERMLIPEYTAVKETFSKCISQCSYAPFLDANIQDDWEHWAIMSRVAGALIRAGGNSDSFLCAAKRAVDARYEFYDRLLDRLRLSEGGQ